MIQQWVTRTTVHNLLKQYTVRMMSAQMVKVEVKQGILRGQQKPLPNGEVYHSFLGIPYAVPPIGDLRFKSPLPLERFDVPELDCFKERDVSHQPDPISGEIVGSENCLHLNVYVPKKKVPTGPLPVMVWIHGGGYVFGHGNGALYFPLSLMLEDVIVVTLNYRLSILGFLCLPEEGVWGNAGLKDQRLALEWIQENISQFNGDPNNVTLFGESAGASSVHLHVCAKHANKLFHKAIMQSGTANMEWVFQINPAYKARKMAELLGCQDTTDTKKVLEFLKSSEITPLHFTENVLRVITPEERRRNLPLPYKPVIEDSQSPDSFIDQYIETRLKQPNSITVPCIMGYNSSEGIAMMVDAVRKLPAYDSDFKRLVPKNIPLLQTDPETDMIAAKMREFYLNSQPLSPKNFNGLVDILTDYHFLVDLQKAVEWHVRGQSNSPLYFYRFEYIGERNFYKKLMQMEKLKGACHGDELFYLFQIAGDEDEPQNEADAKLTKQISNLWANFSKYGNPTPEGKDRAVADMWLPVRRPKSDQSEFVLDYLAIDGKGTMATNPDMERIEFWKNIHKKYPPQDQSKINSKL